MNPHNAGSVTALPATRARRPRYETQFLPAALEIIDTPASPLGRAISATIMAFLCGAIAWAAIGKVDIIATAQGRVIPIGKSKVIQPFDTGVVRAINVKEGQLVKRGDIVIELDPTTDQSDETHLVYALAQDRLDIARLKALLGGKLEDFAPPPNASDVMITAARQQMTAELGEHLSKAASIDRQIAQKESEILEATAIRKKFEETLPLVSEQRDIRKALLADQLASRLVYLQNEQQVVESRNDLAAQTQREDVARQALAALQNERKQIDAEFEKTVLGDLAKAQVQASAHEEELIKSSHKRELRTLKAPVDGVVQQLAIHSLGGVVTPAQQLMVIVPQNAGLEIEATLANRDMGFVHAGQDVEIKVEAFNFTRYGLLHGRVVSVSQDVVAPQDDGLLARGAPRDGAEAAAEENARQARQPSYIANISLVENGIATEQGFSRLDAGMAVTAEIKTGQRTILDYLLSPLKRLQNDALRER